MTTGGPPATIHMNQGMDGLTRIERSAVISTMTGNAQVKISRWRGDACQLIQRPQRTLKGISTNIRTNGAMRGWHREPLWLANDSKLNPRTRNTNCPRTLTKATPGPGTQHDVCQGVLRYQPHNVLSANAALTKGETDRQIETSRKKLNRHTDKQTDRQTDWQAYRYT